MVCVNALLDKEGDVGLRQAGKWEAWAIGAGKLGPHVKNPREIGNLIGGGVFDLIF